MSSGPFRGRGALSNPANRFEEIHLEPADDWTPEDSPAPRTRFYRDATQTIIACNDSPDVGFNAREHFSKASRVLRLVDLAQETLEHATRHFSSGALARCPEQSNLVKDL